tara:strand:- start:1275 stop:4388 length:3114 start_codon:yes stop_codon:yes gene_type:complete
MGANDTVPVNFVIKVYETKALAEEGDELNALYVFNNGIDGDTANPTVANGSQTISGTTNTTGAADKKLKDDNARFGSRLVGKTVRDSAVPANTATITAVDSSTQLSLSSNIMGNQEFYSILEPGFYYTYTKYFYRIEASDVVAGFIIDWDDGEDNSPEKANRQTITLDSPNNFAVVEHTYTKHGKFFPLIRTISIDGFHSKFYSSHDRNSITRTKSLESQTLAGGQNDFSTVSLDLQQGAGAQVRIPEFAPANCPPTGILKVDRKSIFSGIDNDIIAGNAVGYAFVPRAADTLTSYTSAIEVIYETTKDLVLKETIGASSAVTASSAAGDTGCRFPSDVSNNGYLTKVLSVKIVKLKEGTITSSDSLGPDERVHIMYSTGAGTIADNVITTVSLGNPLQTLDRPGFSVLADGSYSSTKNSNVSISTFMFDTDKLNNYSNSTTPFIFPNIQAGTDVFGVEEGGTNSLDQTEPTLRVSYAHKFNAHTDTVFKENHLINSDTKRFYDFERCIKLQVQDTSATTRVDSATFYETNNRGASGSLANEPIDASETAIDVDDGTDFDVNQVIQIDDEFMLITSIASDTLTVVRGYQDTTAASHDDDTAIFVLSNNGKFGDGQTLSQIKHYRNNTYLNYNTPTEVEANGLLLYANSKNPSSDGATGQEQWSNRVEMNSVNFSNFTAVDDSNGDPALVFGGTQIGSGEKNKTELTVTSINGETKRATNYLLVCQEEKFEKIFFRMSNNIGYKSLNDADLFDDALGVDLDMKMTVYYAGRVSKNSSSYEWKPLPYVDNTSTEGKTNSTLRTSGHISFEAPDDWGKIKSSNLPWSSGNDLPIDSDDTGSEDPNTLWTENQYGILIAIAANLADGGQAGNIRCNNVYPADNAHTSIIKVVDPHHKSLNDIAISQGVSFTRDGKFTTPTDRLGRSEIRKIGANSGRVNFGGVELRGDYSTQKKLLNIYQRKSTPVYLDIERANKSGEFIRFYGVITKMSEDYPVGHQNPKFGIEMAIEYVSEFDSNGAPIGEGYLMALGGEILDEPKYLL